MTPETCMSRLRPLAMTRLQRSRGRMTPETGCVDAEKAHGGANASTEPGPDDPGDHAPGSMPMDVPTLQRSRGRMTPETSNESRPR